MKGTNQQRAFPLTRTSEKKRPESPITTKHPITREELRINREENVHPDSTAELILDASSDILFIVDEDMEILAANKKAAEMTNTTKSTLTSQLLSEFIPEDTLHELIAGTTQLADQTMECAPGISYPVDISMKPIQWDELDAFLIKIKSKQTEIEKQELEQQLEQALHDMEVIKRLAGGIAHDANNAASVILGNVGLLKHKGKRDTIIQPPAIKESVLSDIEDATDRMTALIKELLHLATIREDTRKRGDIRPLVEDIASQLKFWETKFNIRIILNMDESAYDCKFSAFPIKNVLQNLLHNAKDAMPSGGTINVAVESINTSAGNYGICISVEDEGVGIPLEDQSKIFKAFFSTKNKEGKGVGLGLANVAEIIRNHNGEIIVESKTGENSGTKFSIFLPK